MTQLTVLVALPEDLSWTHNIHIVAHNYLIIPIPGLCCYLLTSESIRHIHSTDINVGKTFIYIKQ